jgi:hypothetical protein
MNRLLARLQPDSAPGLWIDGTDYCARLFGSPPPWLDVTAGVAWQRKAQDLLRADVLELDATRIVEAACAARADLRAAIAAKSRGGYALKTLLADAPLRALLVEWTTALRSALPSLPLCLRLPSPHAAVGWAWQLAHGKTPEEAPDEDLVDSAALYLADFLRGFASAGLDALLLDEGEAPMPDSALFVLYQSVLNVAGGYQWAVGIACPPGATTAELPAGCDFAIADAALPLPTVVRVPDAFWNGGDAGTATPLRAVRIPPDTQPEQVLQQLGQLRG